MLDTTILEDDRPIRAVHNDRSKVSWVVGSDGVTKIEAYPEKGCHATVPWIAIYNDGDIVRRIPAQMLNIEYKIE